MFNQDEAYKRVCPFMSGSGNLAYCVAGLCIAWQWKATASPQEPSSTLEGAKKKGRKSPPTTGTCTLCFPDAVVQQRANKGAHLGNVNY